MMYFAYAYLGNECNNETQGLPEPVVREGGLLLGWEEDPVQSINLCLPDSITNTPQSSKHVHSLINI